ncbi:DoxX family protein [Chryseobacterium sp. T16E-39]|uniref:DoxX family membrane protein n=1 Tax=Chryseobacterium sp. T16E-39 TaxID=2015076 RepID=UPI000B5B1474|nr:DoxX family membrane protein [Chryseobacterium sp. T16E-39]ASK29330.1 DoxX family protein [Chryseobacterium sp. T16E-39]
MKESFRIPQLLLRCALGITFLTPVSDRLGLLGAPGTGNIEWGNWENFINYTTTLMPFFDRPMVNVMGTVATLSELLIGILLIIGFKTKYAALGASLLTFTFILFMIFSVGIQKPINFGVFTATTASLLLSFIPTYHWSLDNFLKKKEA